MDWIEIGVNLLKVGPKQSKENLDKEKTLLKCFNSDIIENKIQLFDFKEIANLDLEKMKK